MVFEILKWVLAAISLLAVVFNVRKDRRCFVLWIGTNASWAAVDCWYGIWAQGLLQCLYGGLAVWGAWKWKETKKAPQA